MKIDACNSERLRTVTAGIPVALAGLLRAKGTRAHLPRRAPAFAATFAAALILLIPAPASAHFSRPFIRQITGPTAGPFAGPFSTAGPGGLAVDSADQLWVGEDRNFGSPFQLHHFDSVSAGNSFLNTIPITAPEAEFHGIPLGLTPPKRIAINRSGAGGVLPGTFYVTGQSTDTSTPGLVEIFDPAGNFIKRCDPANVTSASALAIDPVSGDLYVATGAVSSGEPSKIQKFNAACEPVSFSASAPYVSGNLIIGDPTEAQFLGTTSAIAGLAIDAEGDIYTIQPGTRRILEFAPSGAFFRFIAGLGQQSSGARPRAIAVDPTNGDLLVSETASNLKDNRSFVEEFDEAGRYLGSITETTPGRLLTGDATPPPEDSTHELALDSHGNLYLSELGAGIHPAEHAVDVYGPGRFVPTVRLGPATGRTKTAAVVNGSVNPESNLTPEPSGYGVSNCHFEYTTAAEWSIHGFTGLGVENAPCIEPTAAQIPTADQFTAVHAAISVASGTTYRYRLAATLSGALAGQAEFSPVLAFTAPAIPAIEAISADNLSSGFADFHATVDPLGAPTTYQFQYLTQAQYEADGDSFSGPGAPALAPLSPASIGAGGPTGSSAEHLTQHIGGLSPSTAYRLRVIAANEIGPAVPIEASFATLPAPATGLTDGRAYELVTPPNKEGAEDLFAEPETNGEFFNKSAGLTADYGVGFLLESKASFGPFSGSGHSAYVFSRDAAHQRWETVPLADPSLGVQSLSGVIADPADLSTVAFNDNVGSLAGASSPHAFNLAGPPGGPYAVAHKSLPLGSETGAAGETVVAGSSRDLSRLVLEGRNFKENEGQPLCAPAGASAAAPLSSHTLCEYTAGQLNFLDFDPKGAPFSCGASLGAGQASVFGNETYVVDAHGAVSANGDRTFFTAPDPAAPNAGPGCWNGKAANPPQLYLRASGSTLEVSKPQTSVVDPTGRHPAAFVGASADGSRVFFLSEAWLTTDHPQAHDLELYCYDVETATVTRVSAGEPTQPGAQAGAQVFNVPTVSASGSAVYFTAFGSLAPTAPSLQPNPMGEGQVNLYRYDVATATTMFIASVEESDYPIAGGRSLALDPRAAWYSNPDGTDLLFGSSRDLTGYSTLARPGDCKTLPNHGGNGNGHCDELYRYDYPTATLTCTSCNPSGAAPTSNARFTRSALEGTAAPPVRAMSDDGSYVFFDTAAPLVPQDANGTLDVYQWHDGVISLISSGKDSAPSYFLGADADAADVFFGTHARLVPADTDTAGDIYDARMGGGFPPPSGLEPCEGDACAPSVPAPDDATPGTLAVDGVGNLSGCPKGKAPKQGKCVAKKHHKKKGTKQQKKKHSKKTTSAKRTGTDRRAGK